MPRSLLSLNQGRVLWRNNPDRRAIDEMVDADGSLTSWPTLEAFVPRFLDGHARANRQKPGGIAQKEVVLRVHLVPQFCLHLAMRGAPMRAIQELAGHRDLSTTRRYMHLNPGALTDAIRLLKRPSTRPARGDILETAQA
jgi:hypothetical protein